MWQEEGSKYWYVGAWRDPIDGICLRNTGLFLSCVSGSADDTNDLLTL